MKIRTRQKSPAIPYHELQKFDKRGDSFEVYDHSLKISWVSDSGPGRNISSSILSAWHTGSVILRLERQVVIIISCYP